jgi:hypothetical protein
MVVDMQSNGFQLNHFISPLGKAEGFRERFKDPLINVALTPTIFNLRQAFLPPVWVSNPCFP